MDATRAATVSERRVADVRERLTAAFGSFRTVDQPWPVDAEGYEDYIGRIDRGTIGGAGAWITDEQGRVLLVRDRGREGWSEPGGHHEPDETLRETARREVREETGLEVRLDGVELFQHLHVRSPADDDSPTLHRTIVTFAATPTGGHLRPDPDEIAEVGWFETHPDPLLYDELASLEIPASEG